MLFDFPDNGSIEHILQESSSEVASRIGNLILLKIKLNNEANQAQYVDKKNLYYSKSNFDWVKDLKIIIWNGPKVILLVGQKKWHQFIIIGFWVKNKYFDYEDKDSENAEG